MVKKTIILLVLYFFFCSFTLLVCREKNILPRSWSRSRSEPGVFGPLEPESEPLAKKYQEPEPELLEKSQEPEPEPLEKKSGAGARAALKCRLPSPDFHYSLDILEVQVREHIKKIQKEKS